MGAPDLFPGGLHLAGSTEKEGKNHNRACRALGERASIPALFQKGSGEKVSQQHQTTRKGTDRVVKYKGGGHRSPFSQKRCRAGHCVSEKRDDP